MTAFCRDVLDLPPIEASRTADWVGFETAGGAPFALHAGRRSRRQCAGSAPVKSLTLAALALLAASPAVAQPAPQPKICDKPVYRQLDFWVGHWDVSPTSGGPVIGHSLIEKLFGDCVVRETWTGPGGSTGGSLSMYQDTTGRWRQTWADSFGAWTEYRGQLVGSDMRFLANDTDRRTGAHLVRRMTFFPLPGGAVRQLIEVSADTGVTWKMDSDLAYRRAAGPGR
jgi:hypothetical protein